MFSSISECCHKLYLVPFIVGCLPHILVTLQILATTVLIVPGSLGHYLAYLVANA